MSLQSILLPVFIEVALIFVLLGLMAKSRQAALRGGVREADIALGTQAYPAATRQVSNAFANQFEMPILFMLAVLLAMIVHRAGVLFVLLEWIFVAARLGHAFVHTTSNVLRLRGALFAVSAAATALLWLLIAFGVLVGVP